MKPQLEIIDPGFGSSFTIKEFTQQQNGSKAYWHFHPEYEIVYISHGRGKRHIGNHISYYQDGDLLFLGPNLPHLSFAEDLSESHLEVVVQLQEDFLGKYFWTRPEMRDIRSLFERAHKGLSFYGETKVWVGERLHAMVRMESFDRLLELLRLLQHLAQTTSYHMLNADGFAVEVDAQHASRVQQVYTFVSEHFQREISLDEIAQQVNMTVPAFCRFFKKLTQKTFTQFVNEVRIAHACRLLSEDHLGIATISFDSGFNNLSHFNKQFRLITGVSPREFRSNLKKLVN